MTDWDGTVALTTPRLVLRTFRQDDLPQYAALNADLEVMRYLGGVALPREESDAIAEYANEVYAEQGIGLLAIERRSDGRFLGMCGVAFEDWYPDDVQLGWRLAREHWGHGYATEAAVAWIGHALGPLGYPRVLAVTDVPNARSRAVMERVGMTLDHEADLVIEGEPLRAVVYAMTKQRWQSVGASDTTVT
jgi:RimJ/RimL family protein N-acetyltransferase